MADTDFNNDGRDDILWQHDDGFVGNWLGQLDGGFAYNAAAGLTRATPPGILVPGGQLVYATGDFNGDGFDDVLWRDQNGAVSDWFGQAGGLLKPNSAASPTSVSKDWFVLGSGDFNGDGRHDILWLNTVSGSVGTWLGQTSGDFAYNAAAGLMNKAADWNFISTGDFNGDGRDDILWRNNAGAFGSWLGQPNGGFAFNAVAGIIPVPTNWTIITTGDFNGDGRDDILWREFYDGRVGTWLAQSDGSFVYNAVAGLTPAATDWHVAAVGDYNGDGRDDILWRNEDGMLGDWLGQEGGRFAYNAPALTLVPTAWHVVPDSLFDSVGPGPWDY